MIGDVIGRRYAGALFQIAQKEQVIDQVRAGLDTMVSLIDTNHSFRYFMFTPRIEKAQKNILLKKIFGTEFPEALYLFLGLLLEKRRQEFLDKIRKHFEILYNDSIGRLLVSAVSARMLSPEEQMELAAVLEKKTGKHIVLSNTIDPSLIGGVHLRMGYNVIDSSVRGKLRRIHHMLKESA